MRNLSNCKITTFRLNSALLTALFSMRREIKGGAGIPGGAVVSRGCSCPNCTNKEVCVLEISVQFLLWQAAKPSGDNCTP